MPLLFKAKTKEGYSLKILAEILQNNLKSACFYVTKKNICLRMMDNHKTVLLDVELLSDNFSVFRLAKESFSFGINLAHLYKMIKSVKKRDSVAIFIRDSNPNELGLKIIPKEQNRVTTSFIKIQNIQSLEIDLPEGYDKPINVSSSEFQKMCKGLTQISNITRVLSKDFLIRFVSDAGGIMKRFNDFGENESDEEKDETKGDEEDEEEDSDDEENQKKKKNIKYDYEEEFDTEQLVKISKLAGLGTNMQIYPKENIPLLFKSPVGGLGKISIYLKCRKDVENDSKNTEE